VILIALMAAQAAAAPPPTAAPPLSVPGTDEERFRVCVEIADADPARALAQAGAWRISGGGVLARHCEALAYVAQKRWVPAATAFEAAARDADTKADGRAANLWVQAGNAALVAGDAARARSAFDAALVRGQAAGIDQGEIYLDRARARFALDDKAGARADLDTALKLVPTDPLAWLLSATLARRSGDLERAATDIAEAAKRSPDDAQVALEAGNIAILSGREDAARTAWQAAVKNGADTQAGKAAADALSRLGPAS
jgi:tetratricopeptide (TPR) repeat protein